jgi:hypothetical protein
MGPVMTGAGANQGERLDSWKAIAAYLGKDAGTVRRWERERGLPVHRVPGGKGTSVYAYSGEIDSWLQSSSGQETQSASPAHEPESQHRRPMWLWIALPTAAAALFVAWLIQRPVAGAVDLRVHLSEEALTAVDGDGRELWVHRLDDKYRHIKSPVAESTRVMRGLDGGVYFLTSQRIGRSDNSGDGGEFTSLDSKGEPRFTFRFFDNVRFGGQSFGPPWAPTAFSVLEAEPRRLAVAAHHWVWSPSIIAILDDNGNRLGTFVSHGWIEQLAWLSPDRLVFGGFLESKDAGLVGLLDPRELDGQAPEPAGSKHHCENCADKPPLKMVALPRSEINLVTQSRFNRAIVERAGDRLIVRTVEMAPLDGQGAADAIYEFTEELELISATYSQRYWENHDRLEREKKIDHDRAHCAFKNGPGPIHIWTPESGWSVRNSN